MRALITAFAWKIIPASWKWGNLLRKQPHKKQSQSYNDKAVHNSFQMGEVFPVRCFVCPCFQKQSNTDKKNCLYSAAQMFMIMLFLSKSLFFLFFFFFILLWIIPLEPSWAQSGLVGWMCLPDKLKYLLYVLVKTEKVIGLKLLMYMN